MIRELRFALKPELDDIQTLFRMIETFGETNGLPEPKVYVVNLVIDELVTNLVMHGANDGDALNADIHLQLTGDGVTLVVEDDGAPFDPTAAETPDVTAALDERPVGKLGLHFVNTLADAVEYRLNKGRNHLTVHLHTEEAATLQQQRSDS